VLKAGHWRIEPLAAKIEGKRLALAIRRWCT